MTTKQVQEIFARCDEEGMEQILRKLIEIDGNDPPDLSTIVPAIREARVELKGRILRGEADTALTDAVLRMKLFMNWMYGMTAREAAMRCCVASRMGEDVELPPELEPRRSNRERGDSE